MLFACLRTKAKDRHLECVIISAFPQQQWLKIHASMLGYTYTACLVALLSFLIILSEVRNILLSVKWRKANCTGHILCRNWLLKHVIDRKTEGRREVMGRWGRGCKLLQGLKEMTEYWKLNKEALASTLWRYHLGRGYRPVIRRTTEWMMNWAKHKSRVGIQTRLDAGQLRNCEPIPSSGKKFLPSPESAG